ncbi:M56 family metallopeptidase [Lacinutrix sp. MEBiC02404]
MNHEKVHAKQFHSIDILCIQLATVVFWFNPFIWLYKKEVQQNLEFIADKHAQRNSTNKKSYEYVLLKTSIANQSLALANNFYTSLIKKRIVMLHKSKSRKLNALKYVLVLPLLTLFLMSFNTKEIYLNTNTSNFKQTIGAMETVIITKNFSDVALDKVISEFKPKDVTLNFKKIERNDRNEIIAIAIEASSKKMKTNFSSNSNNAIKPIKIIYNSQDYSISISTIEANETVVTEDGTTAIVPSESDNNPFILSEEEQNAKVEVITEDSNNKDTKVVIRRKATTIDLNTEASENKEKVKFTSKDKDGNIVNEEIIPGQNGQTWVVEKGGANDVQIVKAKTKDNKLFISTDSENSPLIFIDEKESTKEEMENLDPNNIASINVLKGDKHIRIYGEKAKNGVLLIVTKK